MASVKLKIPSKVHFIGIGGIGMSGLAQMLKWLGCDISGSDRDMDKPENRRIIGALEKNGIRLFPQDGSYASKSKPDYLVYSTAIEVDNPDFVAASSVARIHRSEALASAILSMKDIVSVAVTGTCGKTTVTSWLAETLVRMGHDPSMLSGGLVNSFSSAEFAGNFRPGSGKYFIFEADESDKSLLAYEPAFSIILNTGNDHYPMSELAEVFAKFASATSVTSVVEEKSAALISSCGKKIKIFGTSADVDVRMLSYGIENHVPKVRIKVGTSEASVRLPIPGIHNAMNATAVIAMLDALGLRTPDCASHISEFKGVWRRFNFKGKLPCGASVYDDYAHNPEKIASCMATAREISSGKLICIFQPHGFGPLEFMREKLFDEISPLLHDDDIFIFLPVYYAGGTSSFSPTSEEIVESYRMKGSRNFLSAKSREGAMAQIRATARDGDTVIVMGARDNSLSDWAESLSKKSSAMRQV